MNRAILSIRNVNKFMGSGANYTHVLKDVSFDVEPGEFIAIVGQSGSGKSTLMNVLGCLDEPTTGSYSVLGIDTLALDSNQLSLLRSRTFGFVFQRYNLLAHYTALENVSLPAVYTGMAPNARLKRATELLKKFDLSDKLGSKPNELSGGQQQRVSIARALMNGGKILLADEPTGALDTNSGKAVMDVLDELNTHGQTIILVTHNPEIAEHAQRIIEIQDGRIIADRKREPRNEALLYKPSGEIGAEVSRRDLFVEALKMAIQSIYSHKLRSSLTMLGIVIGIAAVISVIALGRGSQEKILADISALGTNTIEIYPGQGFGDMQSWRVKTLNTDDAAALNERPYILGATPKIDATGVIVYGNAALNSFLYGVGDQFFVVKGFYPSEGRTISQQDVTNINSVVVIDQKTKKRLFLNNENPVGKMIIFNQQPLEIIGVIKEVESSFISDSNPSIFIPYTTLMYRIKGSEEINSIILKIKDDISTQAAEKDITQFLSKRHNDMQDFFTYNTNSIQKAVEKSAETMTVLISCIAFISLVVGGIGVMNIMLVSVTERTAEIGIRMAIGAKQIDILVQFLIESTVICIFGGIIGIFFSLIINPVLTILSSNVKFVYSVDSFILALGFSSFVGILFGFLPARNASQLNPIEALGRD